ncbi:hypothetical protein L7F22_019350 [Adiantum nelumboides]|nr:hypothetical protein [Adiantum nelumboides]
MQGIPNRDAGAAHNEQGIEDTVAPSIIPPRKPKKLGMPKLQLPARPSSSSASVNQPSGSRLAPPSLGLSMQASTSQPSLHLAIPAGNSFVHLNSDADEGYEGSAGNTFNPIGGVGSNTNVTSITTSYPDTVPFASGSQDPYAMANDLRRAIGRISLEEVGNASSDDTESSSRRYSSGERTQFGLSSASTATSGSQSSLRIPGSTNTTTSTGSFANAASHSNSGSGSSENVSPLHQNDASPELKRRSPGQELEDESELNVKGNFRDPRPIGRRTCHSEYITRYYGAYLADEDTSIVICMEFGEAGSLDSIYKRVKQRNGRIGEKILARIAESGLKGLAYLHERKIIHRDIKPSNILVTRDGQIKLCDFGVSGELINSMAGTFTGTSYYMAPERIKGLPYTITSDVWSLGLTVLELASNRFPFPPEGEPPLGPIDLLSYVITMKVPELKDDPAAGVKWTRVFKDFLEHCLEKDGNQRFGPVKMLNHPWMKKAMARVPQPDVGKFVAEVWGLGRVASLRKAPSPIVPLASAMKSINDQSANGGITSMKDETILEEPMQSDFQSQSRPQPNRLAGLSLLTEKGFINSQGIDAEGRTPQDRAKARQREADVGLVGSPTQE